MIRVLKGGLYNSIQDLGRWGYGRYGVPRSGVMDQRSAQICNMILGNTVDSPILEISRVPPVLRFEEALQFCIVGADFSPTVNGVSIPLGQVINCQAGDILRFGSQQYGTWCYLGLNGEYQTPHQLGSYSSYPPAILGAPYLYSSQVIKIVKSITRQANNSKLKNVDRWSNFSQIIATPGPEYHNLQEQIPLEATLQNSSFIITESANRMSYPLKSSHKLLQHNYDMPSAPVLPGTVQLLPNGQLVVLMRDAQTTGGYPRILQIDEPWLSDLAQKRPHDRIFWDVKKPVSIDY